MLAIERQSGQALTASSAVSDTGFVSVQTVRASLGALLDETLCPLARIVAVPGNPICLDTGASLSTPGWHGQHPAA